MPKLSSGASAPVERPLAPRRVLWPARFALFVAMSLCWGCEIGPKQDDPLSAVDRGGGFGAGTAPPGEMPASDGGSATPAPTSGAGASDGGCFPPDAAEDGAHGEAGATDGGGDAEGDASRDAPVGCSDGGVSDAVAGG